jgi:hypothetical protein
VEEIQMLQHLEGGTRSVTSGSKRTDLKLMALNLRAILSQRPEGHIEGNSIVDISELGYIELGPQYLTMIYQIKSDQIIFIHSPIS